MVYGPWNILVILCELILSVSTVAAHLESALHSILCTNRDEYLDRPTQDAHFHSFQTGQYHLTSSVTGNVLSGRDVKAGGSWFGLNRVGRVALL